MNFLQQKRKELTIETKYVLIRQNLFEKTNNICCGIIEFLIREYQCSWTGLSKFCWFVGTKFFVGNWFGAFQCKAIHYFVKRSWRREFVCNTDYYTICIYLPRTSDSHTFYIEIYICIFNIYSASLL